MLRLSKGRVSSATWVLVNLWKVAFLQDGPGGLRQALQSLVPEHGRCWRHTPERLTARGSLVGEPGPRTPLPVGPTPDLAKGQATRFAQDLPSAPDPHFLQSRAFPQQDPQEGPARHAQKVSLDGTVTVEMSTTLSSGPFRPPFAFSKRPMLTQYSSKPFQLGCLYWTVEESGVSS